MSRKGKRLSGAYESIDREKDYTLTDAVKIIKDTAAKTKFDETVEVAINLGVDPRHADQMVRGTVSLPHGTGKSVKVAVFAKDDKAKEAEEAGADLVGAEELAQLSPSSVLINASRGEVVDNLVLLQCLKNDSLQSVVLDVWEEEPSINWELVNIYLVTVNIVFV